MENKNAKIKLWVAALVSVATLLVGFVAGYFVAAPSLSQPITVTIKETVTATIPTGPKYRIGLILSIGGLGDKGFNDAAYAGIIEAKEKLGVEFDLAQPRAIAEFEGIIREFARTGGYDLIISVGFFQVDPLTVVAKDFPNQKFAIIDAVVDQPNVASLIYEEHEGAFLVGVVAGLMTKTGKVGFVGGLDIPLIKYRYVGWAEGVKWANPNVIIYERYVGAFDDPVKGKEIGLELITQGADVLFHVAGRSGLGVLDAAKEKNVFAQGSDQDQSWYAPANVVASLLKGVQLSTFEIIKAVVDKNFRGGLYIYGLKNGGSDIGYGGMVPEEVKNKVAEARKLILEGKIKVTDVRR